MCGLCPASVRAYSTLGVAAVRLDQRDMLRLAPTGGDRTRHPDDEIGTLSVGKQADLAVVDMRAPHPDGYADPVTTLVMGAGAADVETVLVEPWPPTTVR